MKAGDLDTQIVIEAPSATVDGFGQDALTWSVFATRHARAIEEQGREYLRGDFRAEEKAVFVIRHLAVDSTMRVLWGERTWPIVSVTGTRREGWTWLHCVASEGAN